MIFGNGNIYRSQKSESKEEALKNFQALHGKATVAIRYQGTMRPSEAAMTLAFLVKEHDANLKEPNQ